MDDTDEIEDLVDWKSRIIEGREGSRYELSRSKGLPSKVSEIKEISLIVIFLGDLSSGIMSSLGIVISSHFSLSGA